MIKVGMADLKVCKAPEALTTLGLGSCIGVALYDPVTKVSGLCIACFLTVPRYAIIAIKPNLLTQV